MDEHVSPEHVPANWNATNEQCKRMFGFVQRMERWTLRLLGASFRVTQPLGKMERLRSVGASERAKDSSGDQH